MKTKPRKRTFREWFSVEELQQESKKWMSELQFAQDEQRFLNQMIKDYTLDIIDSEMFNRVQPVVDGLNRLENHLQELMDSVRVHENQLSTLIEEKITDKFESSYLESHNDLAMLLDDYFEKYKDYKTQMFEIISQVMKHKKQKRLLN
ncbi:hypothetical protein [Allomuricauda sp. NBRC 101325]|uniref:hypothetical protein n=1 Tax=Allomuricauda sp. NBRC 101325 TaxID=1113758 RepID=UPI0024A3F2DF|nr:hypothetical protein [Muricauda sp. NBRC 101325]GLU45321.1 hypothetical protein Musp01_29450 [Muricauda sp. NBRC 101325]